MHSCHALDCSNEASLVEALASGERGLSFCSEECQEVHYVGASIDGPLSRPFLALARLATRIAVESMCNIETAAATLPADSESMFWNAVFGGAFASVNLRIKASARVGPMGRLSISTLWTRAVNAMKVEAARRGLPPPPTTSAPTEQSAKTIKAYLPLANEAGKAVSRATAAVVLKSVFANAPIGYEAMARPAARGFVPVVEIDERSVRARLLLFGHLLTGLADRARGLPAPPSGISCDNSDAENVAAFMRGYDARRSTMFGDEF